MPAQCYGNSATIISRAISRGLALSLPHKKQDDDVVASSGAAQSRCPGSQWGSVTVIMCDLSDLTVQMHSRLEQPVKLKDNLEVICGLQHLERRPERTENNVRHSA